MNQDHQYETVAKALRWLTENQSEQPDLIRLSRETGLSPHHLQRTFQSWAGVTPKQFLKSLTRQAATERLINGTTVLEAAYASGLSGPGRLHDLMITTEALSPGEIRRRCSGVQMLYGTGITPFGNAVLAWTDRGISFLGFSDENGVDATVTALKKQWSGATFELASAEAQTKLNQVFSKSADQPFELWLRGSPFQLKVWEALMSIPESAHATYGQIAARIGKPSASRAVGSAIGKNPIAWIIPCHRVIRQVGALGGYRWGEITKQAIVGYEASLELRC